MTSMSLDATQRTLHALFRDEATVDEVAARVGTSAARLRVVRRMIRGHVRGALQKCFPCVRAHLSPEAWEELVAGYYAAHPPASFELNHAAAAFPDHLARAIAGGEAHDATLAHAELALLEWEALATYLAPDTEHDPDVRFRVNPTLSLLSLDFEVVEVLTAWDGGAVNPPPGLPTSPMPASRIALIWRHPRRHRVRYRWANHDLLFALKIASEGLDPAEAAEAGGHSAVLGLRTVEAAVASGVLEAGP
jgi:uncharacterized protein